MQPAAGPWRVVRAAFVAAMCLSCSVAGHVLAGGAMPGVLTLAGAVAGVGAVAYALSGARWTFGRLVLVLGVGQLVLHPVFDLAGPPGATTESVAMTAAHAVVAVLLSAAMAHGDLVLWRLAAVVGVLLRPLARVVAWVGVVPVAAPAVRPTAIAADLAVPAGVVLAPSAERAPPARPCST